ncbi:hypothetical protein PANA5342_1104 [Pantoea ananatis LMG 5342]|nr:hypothetical protein PANA5342_1104 [Pantoea ananatis LMG 5342]
MDQMSHEDRCNGNIAPASAASTIMRYARTFNA